MLKLEKIYIDNFKGVDNPRIIDLKNFDLTIMNGPNGFGKTTIFDVIELSLRGKLERTDSFNYIQKNTHNYKKAFYQNTIGRDVVIKTLFRDDETEATHIIIKFLSKDSSGKIGTSKSFKPDSWDIIQSFYTTQEELFSEPVIISQLKSVTQEEIDLLFYKEGKLSLKNLYPLFNYLQQEENIYFLKKDEEEKKSQLDFLFQTRDQAAELERYNVLLRNIRSAKEILSVRIEQLGGISNSPELQPYLKLFSTKELPFDQEEPFKTVDPENLSLTYFAFISELDRIEQFINSFDPEEYKKELLKESINYSIDNSDILKAFLLQNLFAVDLFNQLEALNLTRSRYSVARTDIESNRTTLELILDLGFPDTFFNDFQKILIEKSDLEKAIGEIGKIINDLNLARTNVLEKANQLDSAILAPDHCPLCDADYKSEATLRKVIAEKTTALNKFNSVQLEKLGQLTLDIQDKFKKEIIERIDSYLNASSNQLDKDFFSILKNLKGFEERIRRFQSILASGKINFDSFVLTQPISVSQFQDQQRLLKLAMTDAAGYLVINPEKTINKNLFKDLFDEKKEAFITTEELQNKKIYVLTKFNEAKLFSLNILNARFEQINLIEETINTIKIELDKSIKEYKLDMIEKIKLPFYLYSGKILQNYQQGLGIFIDMQETTNRVRFLTDNDSEHDIIHHLSSGQLAVVSIAFCLALNKVYQTNNHFKFLAIDDPVQTLDDINIHSFIELMRHDFSDYQILMSTHEDDIASYLYYKFDKFSFKCNRINVQETFYS